MKLKAALRAAASAQAAAEISAPPIEVPVEKPILMLPAPVVDPTMFSINELAASFAAVSAKAAIPRRQSAKIRHEVIEHAAIGNGVVIPENKVQAKAPSPNKKTRPRGFPRGHA